MKTPRKEPKPATLKQEAFSKLLNVSPQTVLRWRQAGIIKSCTGTTIETQSALCEIATHFREQLEARDADPLRAEKIRKLKSENDQRDRELVEWEAVLNVLARLYHVTTVHMRREIVYTLPPAQVGRDVHDIRLLAKVAMSRAIEGVRHSIAEFFEQSGPSEKALLTAALERFPPLVWSGNRAENEERLKNLLVPENPARKSKTKAND